MPSQSSRVIASQGDLSINGGQGFKPIKSRINANVGDPVMVGPGGAAVVVYGHGRKVDVLPGAVTTIAPLSPCASGANAEDKQCHPDQSHDCGLTAGTTVFLRGFPIDVGVFPIGFLKTTARRPALQVLNGLHCAIRRPRIAAIGASLYTI